MKTLVFVIFGAVLLALLADAYVRLAPSDPAVWHGDPAAAVTAGNAFVAGPQGDQPAPVLPLPPAEALAAFDAVALSEPRTVRLAGSPESGRITYITRSRLWGFPDYTTVAAQPVEGGTALTIHARARFGSSDLGVNAARIRRWLDRLPRG